MSEVVEPNRGGRRSSTARPTPNGSPSRPRTTEEFEPRYLRASAGSCHDLCKYGVKHEHEAKRRHAKSPRNLWSHPMPSDEQSKTDVSVPQRKKKSGLNLTASPLRDEPNVGHKAAECKDLPSKKIVELADSYTDRTDESIEGSSGMKDSSSSDNLQLSYDHACKNQGEELSDESITIKCAAASPTPIDEGADKHVLLDSSEQMLTTTPMENGSYFVDGLSSEPAGIKAMISSPTREMIASPEGSAAFDHLEGSQSRTTAAASPAESSGSVEHTKGRGVEKPLAQLRGNRHKINVPTRSTIKELKNLKSKESADRRPVGRSEGANGGALRTASGLRGPTEKQKDLSVGEKSKTEMNELKVAQKERTDAVSPQVTEIAGLKKKITSTSKEIRKSVKPEAKLKRSSSATKTAATIIRKVVLKKTLSSSKTGVSVGTSTSMKLKKLSFKSLSSSISLGRITGRKNPEKVIRVSENSNDREYQVAEPSSSTSLSTKPRKNVISTMKLQKTRNISPASAVTNQAKVGRLGVKDKSSYTSQPKPENIDLKAVRQKLRKLISYSSIGKGKHETSGVKYNEGKKSLGQKEVVERSFNDALIDAIKRVHRRTASTHSVEKVAVPGKLKFNRGKVVSIQPENNTPVRLRFRLAKTVNENQNSEVRSTSSGGRIGSGVDSSVPLSEAPTVILRHQDVNEKKETQGLFNNVIEETASKLVETRKSKVKALVGAFETVISLQESKAAPAASVP